VRQGEKKGNVVPEGTYLLFSRNCQPMPSEWL